MIHIYMDHVPQSMLDAALLAIDVGIHAYTRGDLLKTLPWL